MLALQFEDVTIEKIQNSKNALGKPTQIQAHMGNSSHDFLAKIHPFSDLSHLSTEVLGGGERIKI